MALVLNIETSSPVCSVCLANNGQVIAMREDKQGNSHARVLTVLIDDMLKNSSHSLADIGAVAVSAGPGSYTGLRIGVSVAKGLCYALNKPFIAVPTLQALAYGIQQATTGAVGLYMPVIDARRMDMYMSLYNSQLNSVAPTTFETVNQDLQKRLSDIGVIYVGGSAMVKCREVFTLPQMHFISGVECHATFLAPLAEERFRQSKFESKIKK